MATIFDVPDADVRTALAADGFTPEEIEQVVAALAEARHKVADLLARGDLVPAPPVGRHPRAVVRSPHRRQLAD